MKVRSPHWFHFNLNGTFVELTVANGCRFADSLAGQMNALKQGGISGAVNPKPKKSKKKAVLQEDSDESDTEGEVDDDDTSETDTETEEEDN